MRGQRTPQVRVGALSPAQRRAHGQDGLQVSSSFGGGSRYLFHTTCTTSITTHRFLYICFNPLAVHVRTLPQHRVAATAINWKRVAARRHIRGEGYTAIHQGYSPFKFASATLPQTEAQALVQSTRTDQIPPFHVYPRRKVSSYPLKKWKEIENGPELFGES